MEEDSKPKNFISDKYNNILDAVFKKWGFEHYYERRKAYNFKKSDNSEYAVYDKVIYAHKIRRRETNYHDWGFFSWEKDYWVDVATIVSESQKAYENSKPIDLEIDPNESATYSIVPCSGLEIIISNNGYEKAIKGAADDLSQIFDEPVKVA